jgi:hypothetical protein
MKDRKKLKATVVYSNSDSSTEKICGYKKYEAYLIYT